MRIVWGSAGWAVAIGLLAAEMPAGAEKQASGTVAGSQNIHSLENLSPAEAEALLAKLRALQAGLKRGDELVFELLSGAPASYDMADRSPREAFITLPLDRTWRIERVPTDNLLWQPYKLVVTPNGLGQLMWEVEVVLGINGDLERIEMVYRAPPPF